MVFNLVVLAVFSLILLFYIFSKWRYSYWTRKGVRQLNPELYYGDLRKMLRCETSMGETFRDIYSTFKKQNLRYGGIYWILNPQFIPVDRQIIKDIMLKSFSHFQDRGVYHHKSDILSYNLFRMEGEEWKQLRNKLTPTFTSAKMKSMFDTLLEKNQSLKEVASEYAQNGGIIDVKDVSARYTTDVIGSCAFGIECDSLRDRDCEFRIQGSKFNRPRKLQQWLENTVPKWILGNTGYKSFPDLEGFYRSLVMDTINYRETYSIHRKDFMHLLIQLRNRGVLTEDGNIAKTGTEKGVLTDDEVVAQSFVFFIAGYDTSAGTMGYILYELAKHPDIQNKVREEIRQVLKKYDGKLTYEGTKELVFTEQVVFETLRKYPAVHTIQRKCTKSYNVPDSDVVLEKGTLVQLPCWGIHMDPEYYPNPEVWDPERFSKENIAKRPEFTYFPFGDGPRVCIGERFAKMQATVGLTGLLKDFHYSVCEETPDPLTYLRAHVLLHTRENIVLKITKATPE